MVIVFHSTFFAMSAARGAPAWSAAWMVGLTDHLSMGVPIFFVISGYCISATADAARRRQQGTLEYFRRRIRRIYPPYLIWIGVLACCIALISRIDGNLVRDERYSLIPFASLTKWQMVGNLTLSEGWLGYLVRRPGRWFLGSAWTLGYEEQFYAVTGFLLLVLPRRFFLGAGLVSLLVFFTRDFVPVGFFMDGLWLHFAEGVLVYYALVYGSRRQRQAIGVALCLAILVIATTGWSLAPRYGREYDLFALGTATLLLALRPYDSVTAKTLSPLGKLGLRTYSLYIVHQPVCLVISGLLWRSGIQRPVATLLLTVPACVLGSIAVGFPFCKLAERPFLNRPMSAVPEPPAARAA
jgi:peptidoglycan/LPS O-acetylase OafA/YrhL